MKISKNLIPALLTVVTVSALVPAWLSQPAQAQFRGRYCATLYKDVDSKGPSVDLYAGRGTNFVRSSFNDNASSIKVARGYSVTLFSEGNFRGKRITLGPGSYNLTNRNFNDVTSSAYCGGR